MGLTTQCMPLSLGYLLLGTRVSLCSLPISSVNAPLPPLHAMASPWALSQAWGQERLGLNIGEREVYVRRSDMAARVPRAALVGRTGARSRREIGGRVGGRRRWGSMWGAHVVGDRNLPAAYGSSREADGGGVHRMGDQQWGTSASCIEEYQRLSLNSLLIGSPPPSTHQATGGASIYPRTSAHCILKAALDFWWIINHHLCEWWFPHNVTGAIS
jgi:hypothetical protein